MEEGEEKVEEIGGMGGGMGRGSVGEPRSLPYLTDSADEGEGLAR